MSLAVIISVFHLRASGMHLHFYFSFREKYVTFDMVEYLLSDR